MRILGIDPGSHVAGYGLVESLAGQYKLLDHGILKQAEGERLVRLARFAVDVKELLDDLRPDGIALELAHWRPGKGGSGLVIAEARGIVIGLAAIASPSPIPIQEVQPSTAKRIATGSGRATKEAVRVSISNRFGVTCKWVDASDAIALALAYRCSFSVVITASACVVAAFVS